MKYNLDLTILDEKLKTIQGKTTQNETDLNISVYSGPSVTLLCPGITSPKMQIPRQSSWPRLPHSPTSGPGGTRYLEWHFTDL